MSGSFLSSGKITCIKEKPSEIFRLKQLKIKSLSIQVIPLSNNASINSLRYIGKIFEPFIHPIFYPKMSHIAIQLNMENDKDILILEYGQYFSDEGNLKTSNFFISILNNSNSLSNSFGPILESNSNTYWFINENGARVTKINNMNFNGGDPMKEINLSDRVKTIIASQHYDISIEKLNEMRLMNGAELEFCSIDCDVNNKITLGELCEILKDENWDAEHYNFTTKNCHRFAARVIKHLKATRKNDRDKIRMYEKWVLPNCIIGSLWDNEELSVTNTIGRIPILGLFHDLIVI